MSDTNESDASGIAANETSGNGLQEEVSVTASTLHIIKLLDTRK